MEKIKASPPDTPNNYRYMTLELHLVVLDVMVIKNAPFTTGFRAKDDWPVDGLANGA